MKHNKILRYFYVQKLYCTFNMTSPPARRLFLWFFSIRIFLKSFTCERRTKNSPNTAYYNCTCQEKIILYFIVRHTWM